MKIIKLSIDNFKRLVAVEIEPDGSTIMLTGKNGAGKSSVLDAITSALCGKNYQPEKPIRDGQDHAEVVIETENYIIKRTFTESGGGSLTVTNAEGFKAASPQALLDKIVGEIAFDPMMFTQGTDARSAREQKETLMKLCNLDFADIDAEIVCVKEARSIVKAKKESYDHEAERIDLPEGLPAEEINVTELVTAMQKAVVFNSEQDALEFEISKAEQNRIALEQQTDAYVSECSRLNDLFAKATAAAAAYRKEAELALRKKEELTNKLGKKIDLADIKAEIDSCEKTNKGVRLAASRREYEAMSAEMAGEFSSLGLKMKSLEESKAKRLKDVKMPIDGLSIDENGITFGGIPLAQVNDAKKLEIGVAISMAMNPTLKVILVRNGSLLDGENKAFLSRLVEEKGYQVWMEVTDDTGKVGLVIEDGSIVATNTPKPKAKPKPKAGEQLPLL
jgi:DNA repair exonuclease SbcCD ATPase subunit